MRHEDVEMQAEGLYNDQCLSELAGRFAVLKITDKAHPGTGRQGEIGLSQAQGLALSPDEFAYFFWFHVHRRRPSLFPKGNNQVKPAASQRIIPVR